MSAMNNVQVESTIIKRNPFLSILKQIKNMREMNIILIIIAVCVIMSFASPYFLTWGNIESIVMQFSTEGIVVIGMTVMLILGGIDISVGSIMCFSMVLPAKIFLAGVNPWISALAGLVACLIIGAINGFFVTKVGLHPFITTLATAGIIRGACYVLTQGSQISLYTLPDSFKYIGLGKVSGIPFIIVLFIIIVIISDFMLRKTSVLRNVFYTGSNEKAARFSGINVDKVKFWVFVLCAGLTGLAGIIFMARFGMATPNFGVGLEMTAIASAVIGGASMSGGKGTVFGSILGICLYYLISSSLILLHVNAYWQEFARGLILLIAISIDSIGEMRKSRRSYKAAA
ncbi:MAG: ABC transporter permease [Clostridiaceae bacterium]|jgi:ribose transport system permease protein|nr:ABC transporter permease [Clostridiaceae bacterium]